MRTPEEIMARMEAIENEDWLGFERTDLVIRLPWPAVRPYLNDEAVAKYDAGEEKWEPCTSDPIQEIRDYMDFAWDKANNCRGISASRSISHLRAWLWLAGEDEFIERLDMENYDHYGKPQLRAICERFEIDWRQYDDGYWRNDETSEGVGPDDVAKVG